MSDVELSGKGVVVTGGGNGIGRAIATRMAAEGARVLVNDLDAEAAESVAAAIGGTAYAGDVSTTEGAEALVEHAFATLGSVDLFFANAGIDTGRGLETDDATWERVLDVNVMAHVRTARALVPRWVEAGGGHLVVTASAAGLLTMIGNAPYSVTKHAAVAFAEWLSITYGDQGVTVQAICPQGVNTAMLRNSGDVQEMLSRDAALEPEDVAEAVVRGLDGGFLILPHPEVAAYYAGRAADPDRWLGGMRKLHRRVFG